MINDRFKFRIWDEKTKKLVYFDFHELVFMGELKGSRMLHKLTDVRPIEASEQSTGLKDKNGKLIYEGDILSYSSNKLLIGNYPFVVGYHGGSYNITQIGSCGAWNLGEFDELQEDFLDYCEVIGNIHENTDLLEGK
ncbi:MAG: hypothetical protein GY793_08440 [Proteobacteria bacterium]|nr:hypothetical protein [Pseudomonadota bacterium]